TRALCGGPRPGRRQSMAGGPPSPCGARPNRPTRRPRWPRAMPSWPSSTGSLTPRRSWCIGTKPLTDTKSDLALALSMADRADEMSMAVFTGRPLAYVDKDDGSPVTETDRLVEETLRGMVADVRS